MNVPDFVVYPNGEDDVVAVVDACRRHGAALAPFGGGTNCPWATNNCGPNDEPYGFHTGGLNACMADGSVRFLTLSINPSLFKRLGNRADGELLDEER